MSRSAHATSIAVFVGLVSLAASCPGDDPETGPKGTDPPAPEDTGPTTTSARSTPFCVGMMELAERLEQAEATDDTAAMIRSAYAELAEVVPAEIQADFEAVRQQLVDEVDAGGAPSTTAPIPSDDVTDATAADGDGEGASPAETPTERLVDYVDLTCRSTANNPGPPETEPP